jgi:hypothetical protein
VWLVRDPSAPRISCTTRPFVTAFVRGDWSAEDLAFLMVTPARATVHLRRGRGAMWACLMSITAVATGVEGGGWFFLKVFIDFQMKLK